MNRLSPRTPGQGLGKGPPWLSRADTFVYKAASTGSIADLRVRLLIYKLRSHMPRGQKLKTRSRRNVVTNSLKTLKSGPHKKYYFKILKNVQPPGQQAC